MSTNVAAPLTELPATFCPGPSRLSTLRERMLARVSRWSIVPTIQRQSVAEHSFYVALMASRIAVLIRWKCTNQDLFNLERYALLHDSLESVTGDLPTPVKKHLKELKSAEGLLASEMTREFRRLRTAVLSDAQPWVDIKDIVGFADSIEALSFLHTETLLGNKAVFKVAREIRARVEREFPSLPFGASMNNEEKLALWENDIVPVINGHERDWPTVA